MSGLFGLLGGKRDLNGVEIVRRMRTAMSHRDWFVADIHSDKSANVHLGRIGIGILNPEPQPIWSEDGNLAVFLTGEFYQTDPIRKDLERKGFRFRNGSDIELALKLYQDKGEHFIEDVEGVFVAAVWNRARQELLLANDRFGLYPTYYAHFDGRLVFAPEIKGILCDGDFRKNIDWVALSEYMCFQHLLGDKTFFEGLNLLPGASILTYSPKTDFLLTKHYWDFSHISKSLNSVSFEGAREEAGRLLKASMQKRTGGGQRLAIPLSGGLDSRTILGLIDRDERPIITFTYGMPGSRDVEYARQIASKARTRHHYFPFNGGRWVLDYAKFHLELTEGFHSWIHAHSISIMNDLRGMVDVCQSGLGGAELNWEDQALYGQENNAAFLASMYHNLSQQTTWPSIDRVEEPLIYALALSKKLTGLAFDSLRSELLRISHLPRALQIASLSRNSDRRLYQYYAVFSRAFFEMRFPFLDYEYVEFVHRLPVPMLFHRNLRKAVVRQFTPLLASVAYDRDELPVASDGAGRMMRRLCRRGKSFINHRIFPIFKELYPLHSDYENWLRTDLKMWGEKLLLDERTLQRGVFNPDYVRSLWLRHQTGSEPFTIGKIAPIMTYEMMLRRFYDE
jgi:asparagine synthase (glutamine-hydrolysing)